VNEERTLAEQKAKLEEKYGICIIIYFTQNEYPTSISESTLTERMYRDSKEILDEHRTSSNAIIYYMSLDGGYRDYYFNRIGTCLEALEDGEEVDKLKTRAERYMTKNDFYGAALEFLSVTDSAMELHNSGKSYFTSLDSLADALPVILAVSAIIALIVVLVMKAGMKSVKLNIDAQMYTRRDSFNIRAASDIFLYRTVSKRRKPESSSGGSRGGGSRGGGSRGGGGRC